MKITISQRKRADIMPDMMGLFFEDINYAADGGLYAEMLENRAFEFVDCYGDKADYYTEFDGLYGWECYPKEKNARMRCVMGSPVAEENPHYLRFTAEESQAGFKNQAYDGIVLKKGAQYGVSFYARSISYQGRIQISVQKDGIIAASGETELLPGKKQEPHNWKKYHLLLTAKEDVKGGDFAVMLEQTGVVEFDFFSMMPKDAVCGIFRRDLFELLKDLQPGFIRFPGGCIIEGNTLSNRYRFKETLKPVEHRRSNWNRWAVHLVNEENGYHSVFSHYNQTLGMGYYEFFLLCEALGAKPLPVLNVGLACQYQSYEMVQPGTEAFGQYLQDALDLIEFANGAEDGRWGSVRVAMGHKEPFHLTMLGIGNEQWETEKSGFFERYRLFEECIHAKYPEIRLIGSAGPDITSERYEKAWKYYHGAVKTQKNYVYAVDEHYYVEPDWFYAHTDFYDEYPRDVKVFAGEYAAHPGHTELMEQKNCLGGALAEAAFLTGVERNADVVVLASYAPLFARLGFTQWAPDMIWFDGETSYATPNYYVQKMFSCMKGTSVLDTLGEEKKTQMEQVYYNPVRDDATGAVYCKIVNASEKEKQLTICDETGKPYQVERVWLLGGMEKEAFNSLEKPDRVAIREMEQKAGEERGVITLEKNTFAVLQLIAPVPEISLC